MAERFGRLLGTWTGLERIEARPPAPATTARAFLVFKLDLAATVVLQDYRQVRADGEELSGHGVFLAEPGTGNLLWWFFDSSGRPPVPAQGGGRHGELVLGRTTSAGHEQHRFRATADRLHRQVLLAAPGADLDPFLTATYQRISGH